MNDISIPAEYFDTIYARDADPWGYATSPYEKRKYAATLAALPRLRFSRAFEPGCSIGVLTRMLAPRCGQLLAADMSEISLGLARARCRDMRNIRFRRMRIPADWPPGTFDLVVLSEVLYYQSQRDVSATACKIQRCLRAGGAVIIVHWLGVTGTARSGDQVARQFIRQTTRVRLVARRRTALYRLDVLRR
jgi:SAM-dependent methyltransferase